MFLHNENERIDKIPSHAGITTKFFFSHKMISGRMDYSEVMLLLTVYDMLETRIHTVRIGTEDPSNLHVID